MLVKFTESTEFEGRHYARGDVRDFDHAAADALIKSGVAVDPEKVKPEAPAKVAPKTHGK